MRLRRAVMPAAICALLSAPVALGHPSGLDAGSSTAVPFLQPDGQLGNAGPFTRSFRERAQARAAATARVEPVRRNVRVVGKAQVTNPAGTGNLGRIADVSAHGDYAYLTAFREPTCEHAGAHVFDISNPKKPFEIEEAFMETTPQNYAGEGSHTLRMNNQFFKGVLFMHQNETCPGAPAPTAPNTRGGINIWDITEGDDPQLLVKHAGDNIGGLDSQPNQTHSQFAWTNKDDQPDLRRAGRRRGAHGHRHPRHHRPAQPAAHQRHARPGRAAVRRRPGVAERTSRRASRTTWSSSGSASAT